MSDTPDEISVLCEVYQQLTSSSPLCLSLSREQRTVLRELFENSAGHTQGNIAETMVAILDEQQDADCMTITAEIANLMRGELEASIPSILKERGLLQRSLITVPHYITRMDDSALCELVYGQLFEGNSFALPETEMMQLTMMLEDSLRHAPEQSWMNDVLCALHTLKKDEQIQTVEPMFRVSLQPQLRAKLLLELGNALKAAHKESEEDDVVPIAS